MVNDDDVQVNIMSPVSVCYRPPPPTTRVCVTCGIIGNRICQLGDADRLQTHPPSTGELHLSRIIIICARRASGPILHLLSIISAHCAGVDTLYCASFDCCDNCSSDAPVQKLIP